MRLAYAMKAHAAMSDPFIPISDDFLASPQITLDDIQRAAAQGVTLIINNRPDLEEPGQIAGAEIEQAAKAAGLDYVAIPVGSSGLNYGMLDAFLTATENTSGKTLAFCKSGMRSAAVRAFAKVRSGAPIDAILNESAQAGFDLNHQRPMLEQIAAAGRD